MLRRCIYREACIVWGSVVCEDIQLNSKWNNCIFIRFKYISFLDFIYLFYVKVSSNMTLSYMNIKNYSFFSFSSAFYLSFVTSINSFFLFHLSLYPTCSKRAIGNNFLSELVYFFFQKWFFFSYTDSVYGRVTNCFVTIK